MIDDESRSSCCGSFYFPQRIHSITDDKVTTSCSAEEANTRSNLSITFLRDFTSGDRIEQCPPAMKRYHTLADRARNGRHPSRSRSRRNTILPMQCCKKHLRWNTTCSKQRIGKKSRFLQLWRFSGSRFAAPFHVSSLVS